MTGDGVGAAAAVAVGGIAAIIRVLLLADPPPSLAAGLGRAVAGWGLGGSVLLAADLAWGIVGAREGGRAQRWFLAGAAPSAQLRGHGRDALRRFVRRVPWAAGGGLVAAGVAGVHAGGFRWIGPGGPGPVVVVAALVAPVLGGLLGALVALAAPERRTLCWGAAWAVIATVSVHLLRPFGSLPSAVAPWTPLGAVWPVTPGWSPSRRFAVTASPSLRLASLAVWVVLLAVPAVVRWRRSPVARAEPRIPRRYR